MSNFHDLGTIAKITNINTSRTLGGLQYPDILGQCKLCAVKSRLTEFPITEEPAVFLNC